ncbi:divalent metal cation transporter [Thiomonas sp.]|uniref:NRAMP family divalent metal transporter n=1 Tax=Thiomonas sp. TaxID=2047785 RepID=UPI00258279B0|nr:divalent metal cation transporter [Thiomonas sp.]
MNTEIAVLDSKLRPERAPLPDDLEHRLRDRLYLDELRRGKQNWRTRLALGLALIGPGVLVMLGDNDAGGVVTYAQTGATYGLGIFLPMMILLGFVAYVVQEMTVRLGAVTRRGHAELIWKRYGAFWGWFSLIDLVVANVLTLMTEFIGIRLGGQALGLSPWLTVPASLVFITYVLVFLRYWTWERISLFIAVFNLIFVPLALLSHPNWHAVAQAFVGHGWIVPGGFLSLTFLVLISANIGTTIAPWQLFFQQSCVVDKGLLPQDIRAGRRDLMLGVVGMVLVAMAIIVLAAQTLKGVPKVQNLDADLVLGAIRSRLGDGMMALFALGLMEAGLIASIVITASTAWAVGEAFEIDRSINASPRKAIGFYLPAIVGTALAAIAVLIPGLPLGFLNISVQVIATVFMPAAMLFLLMLLNDRELMGAHVNSARRNMASIAIMAGLITCNVLYGIATLFPRALGG